MLSDAGTPPAGGSFDRCLGRYLFPLYGHAEIRREDGRLTLRLLGRTGKLHLSGQPNNGQTYQVDWGDDLYLMLTTPTVRFVPGAQPAADQLVLAGARFRRGD